MTEALAIPTPAPLAYSEMSDEQRLMLKQVCAGTNLNDQQFALLCEVGKRTGLDPLRRQIYGLIFQGRFIVMTGIDGFRAVARRNGLAGIDAPRFEYVDEQKRIPSSCEVTVYRWGRGGKESYTARCLFREFARFGRDGKLMGPWQTSPHHMLQKCTEALAHRMAFTEWMGGVYERDEFPREHVVRQQQPATTVDELISEPADQPAEVIYDDDPTAKDAP